MQQYGVAAKREKRGRMEDNYCADSTHLGFYGRRKRSFERQIFDFLSPLTFLSLLAAAGAEQHCSSNEPN